MNSGGFTYTTTEGFELWINITMTADDDYWWDAFLPSDPDLMYGIIEILNKKHIAKIDMAVDREAKELWRCQKNRRLSVGTS